MRTSFSYYLPNGITVTYSGEAQSYFRWLRCTLIGGWGAWSMWFHIVRHLLSAGIYPDSKTVVRLMCESCDFFGDERRHDLTHGATT